MENKNNKNKKKIIIVIIAAIVAVAVIVAVAFAVASGNGKPGADDTGIDDTAIEPSVSDESDEADVQSGKKDPVKDPETDENGDTVESGESGDEPDVSVDPDDPTSNVTDPVVPPVSGTLPGINPDPDDPEVDPDDTIDDDEPDDDEPLESTIVVDPGKNGDSWPESLPAVIPAFKGDLVFSNNCSYEKYDEQEVWYMSWDASAVDYDAWMKDLANAGFAAVPDVFGFYANGEYILDITTEQGMTTDSEGELIPSNDIWVSMDVYHAMDIVYPDAIDKVMPDFDLDATLEYWYHDARKKTVTLYYQTPYDWAQDIAAISSALSAKGFSVSDGKATKDVDGSTVTVTWSGSNNNLVITY